jgi:hypothetical protein
MRVLKHLLCEPITLAPHYCTIYATTNLNESLLLSSPLEPTELQQSNKRFQESLRECPAVVSPVRRHIELMTTLCET